jgi:hypothetical protein
MQNFKKNNLQKVSIDTISMIRPSHKEISGKIKEAKEAAAKQRIFIVEPMSFAADALELDYPVESISKLILILLDEIKPGYYAGHRPPQRSYENCIKGADLFSFQWKSNVLNVEIYFKFALREDNLWLVSLHKSRKK